MRGAKLIVVLGHSGCGAIKGACDHVELGHLTQMLAKIGPAVDSVASCYAGDDCSSNNSEFVEAVATENVKRAVSGIAARSTVLRDLLDNGEIGVVGGMYNVASGEVEFLD